MRESGTMESKDVLVLDFGTNPMVSAPSRLIELWNRELNTVKNKVVLDISRLRYLRPFTALVIYGLIRKCQQRGIEVRYLPSPHTNVLHQIEYLGLDQYLATPDSTYRRGSVEGIKIQLLRNDDYSIAEKLVRLIANSIRLSSGVRQLTHLGLKECIDNVYVHTPKDRFAVVTANAIKTRKRIRICILDTGARDTENSSEELSEAGHTYRSNYSRDGRACQRDKRQSWNGAVRHQGAAEDEQGKHDDHFRQCLRQLFP